MAVASRTPEGEPFACRVCGTVDRVEVSPLVHDAVCTRCGGYIAKFLGHFERLLPRQLVSLDQDLAELLANDSLTVVEWVMELEEEFGVVIDSDEVERCRTVEEFVRYIHRLSEEKDG